MVFSLISSTSGFIREILIAAIFGSTWQTDAYFVAITGVQIVNLLLASSLRTILIPILTDVEGARGKNRKIQETNNFINFGILTSLVLIVVGVLAAPLITKVLASGFVGEQFELAVLFLRIGMASLIFKTIVGIYRGYLQSEERFFESGLSDASVNFLVIFFLLTMSARFGIIGLAVFNAASEFSQLLLQIPGLKKTRYFYNLYLNLKSKHLSRFMMLLPPVLISTAINDVQKIIDKTIASNLVEGSISALNYAEKIERTIISVFVTALVTVLFPTLSKKASNDNYDEIKRVSSSGLNSILLITLPASLGLMVFASPIVELVYQRGQFDAKAAEMTAIALVFYALGIVPFSLRMYFNNVYFAIQDTKTPMINGAISVGIKIVLSLILVQYLQHAGLPLASVIAVAIMTGLLIKGLSRKIGYKIGSSNIKVFLKSTLSSVIIVIMAYFAFNYAISVLHASVIGQFFVLIISVSMAAVIYSLILFVWGVEEVKTIGLAGWNRIKKFM
ncbi:MAG: murein biosynthesis integral membrane protein MurJ [Anaerolineaceae bacterium]|nr:murein biosynthesis integral membrane protein MurJ [Anaerolineaceae bacterium]